MSQTAYDSAVVSASLRHRNTTSQSSDQISEAFFEWLSPSISIVDARRADLHRRQRLGTLNWVSKMKELEAWRAAEATSDKRVLWLNGSPGIGKSTIAAFVIDDLLQNAGSGAIILYFICNDQSPYTHVYDIIRTFAYQLFTKSSIVRHHLETIHKSQPNDNLSSNSVNVLFEMLIQSPCSELKAPLYIILDGLDKCRNDKIHGSYELAEFLTLLIQLPNSRLLVTSTRTLSIPCLQQNSRQILPYENLSDIADYVRARIAGSRTLEKFFQKRDEDPVEYLTSRAGGIFLWVVLVLSSAEDAETMEDFNQALKALPSDLEDVYRTILSRVKHHSLVREVLIWLVGSERDLTTKELLGAIEISGHGTVLTFEEGFLQKEIGSLIQFSCSSAKEPTIRLIHATLNDYLTDPLHNKNNYFYTPGPSIHRQITIACLRHIMTCPSATSFTKYAVHYWMEHFRQIGTNSSDIWSVWKELILFLQGNGLEKWIKWECDDDHYRWSEFQIGFIHRIVNCLYSSLKHIETLTPCNGDDQTLYMHLRTYLDLGMGGLHSLMGMAAARVWIHEKRDGWSGSLSPAGHLAFQCRWAYIASSSDPSFDWNRWHHDIRYDYEFHQPLSVEDMLQFAGEASYDPASATCLSNLAEALHSSHHTSDAIGLLEQASRLEPTVVRYIIGLGDLHEIQGCLETALKYYQHASNLDFDGKTDATRRYWNLKAKIFEENQDMDRAVETYKLAILNDPNHSSMHTGQYYMNLASMYHKKDEYENARGICKEAKSRDPKFAELYWAEEARTYVDEGNWTKAIDTYVEALKTLAQDRKYIVRWDWVEVAEFFHNVGDCTIAKELMEAAVENDPEGKCRFYLGILSRECICVGDWDAAIEFYEELLRPGSISDEISSFHKKKSDMYLWFLGLACMGKQDFLKAESCFLNLGGVHLLVEIYVRQERFYDAIAQCKRGLQTEEYPERIGEILYDLGWLYQEVGEPDESKRWYYEAIRCYTEAVNEELAKLDGDEDLWILHLINCISSLALTYERLGELVCAKGLLEFAGAVAEDFPTAVHHLEEIKFDLNGWNDDHNTQPTWLERKEKNRSRMLRSHRDWAGRWLKPFDGCDTWAEVTEKRLAKDREHLNDVSKSLRTQWY